MATKKLLLLALTMEAWDDYPALPLCMVSSEEAQAGINAALLGGRQAQSAHETMHSALSPAQQTFKASSAFD